MSLRFGYDNWQKNSYLERRTHYSSSRDGGKALRQQVLGIRSDVVGSVVEGVFETVIG